MSHLFYDHLVSLEDLEAFINEYAETKEEKEELWTIVDELVHHHVIGCILDELPEGDHEEFMERLVREPHAHDLIIFISEKTKKDKTQVEETIRQKTKNLSSKILEEIG